ncbi:hypothetical protein OOZ15_18105 [Galbibacter sp. EGI 63066]|uniref:hypothetical protein n=1 Tax=Galbibacter sp. EGI 63066 TaxID=2993559 RepID=UPI00224984B2|nr:hypothetical protein [Galbibacter sp. EGI 63066]MCX2681872.1 hypothetical protein [Galbibacter sp. EGI 63066]
MAKNQTLTFAIVYGWSNNLFFVPENLGIGLYSEDGTPIEGDVSSKKIMGQWYKGKPSARNGRKPNQGYQRSRDY